MTEEETILLNTPIANLVRTEFLDQAIAAWDKRNNISYGEK